MILFGLMVVMFAIGFASRAPAKEQTREIMDGVFDAIAYLLPLSVRESAVASEWDRELIDSKLAVLRNSSAALVAHTADRSPDFRFLANAFDETVREIDTSAHKKDNRPICGIYAAFRCAGRRYDAGQCWRRPRVEPLCRRRSEPIPKWPSSTA